MTEEESQRLLDKLKEIASKKHCYELQDGRYEYPEHNWDVFDDGADYGEILLARTLLECLGLPREETPWLH